MSPSDFFIIMGAIYMAPHLDANFSRLLGIVSALIGVGFIFVGVK